MKNVKQIYLMHGYTKNNSNQQFCNHVPGYIAFVSFCLLCTCSHLGFITPNPRYSQMPVTNGQDSLQAPAPVDTSYIENSSDVDFGELIDSLNLAGESDSSTNAHSPETFSVKTDIVRVAVLQNVQTVTVLSDGVFRVKSSVTAQPLSCSRINFQYSKKSGADFVIGVSDKWTKEFVLPCTLTTGNSPWLLRCNNDPYRGILIIVSDGNGSFSVVNSLQMEEYLRG